MISIVIPARNEEDNIGRLFESLEDNDFDDYEVIVVDGDSDDGTREVARKNGARVIKGPGKGLAAAQNLGWRNAKGDIIWFIDADCELEKDSLKKAQQFFDNNPDKDIGGLDIRHKADNWIEKSLSAENTANAGKRRLFNFIYRIGRKAGVFQ